MAARVLVQGREQELREKFGRLDGNGDRRLHFHEVQEFLKKEGPTVNDRQAMIMFSRIDKNGTGTIEFSEFCEYVMSLELLAARKSAMKSGVLRPWDGPAQLKVNGSWDRETRQALQEFLAVQQTPTSRVVKPSQFVNGNFSAQHIIVLQELLDMCKLPSAIAENSHSLACGTWTERTTRALHELLLLQGAPTAVAIGEKFMSHRFSKTTVIALQEFLAMMRKSRGTALGAVR
mmetsp:Transcript_45761/g.133247  ORF Transcript_45761/g.133247 Transcript_45761/m.133247 type:complete len:233 (-) Transcript_45761:487-1185(-)|eukprot:CAMPEP_0170250050 /NCGR_PEP_ID=MMETSP0116_2-20130129/24838_1 /TAXON_ID=400756 /ORGANISM="Durinskia baltica, Strain CSIRO CS-38" /LENGTH=232 /DNA_ID=CAMNT_0010500979 /DNA_START=134 /DNA_END=832 /DNA_ORIENTATION=+